MQRPGLLLFLTIALAVYSAVNGYILWRGWPAAAGLRPAARRLLLALFLFSSAVYPLGRLGAKSLPLAVGDTLVLIGAFYLAFMVYFFLALILIDLFRCGRFLFRLFFKAETRSGLPAKPVLLILIGLVSLTVLLGYWNARTVRVRTLDLYIPKKAGPYDRLTVVMASDLHLGRIIRNHRLEDIVALINRQKPDVVLLPGDLTDEDVSFLTEQNMAPLLKKITAPRGVYAVTGNHEYYSGKKQAIAFLNQAGIRVLEDEVVRLGSLVIAGRKDRTAERFGEDRKPLALLLRGLAPEDPVILMDHQPFHLEEASRCGVDLQLSGHTHHGQLFPINYIVGRIFELTWGYLRKGATHVYVSCGAGTWGPPVRTSSLPEIVNINLRFQAGDGKAPPAALSPDYPPLPGSAVPGPGPSSAPTGR